ncbi:hypothetical protein GGS24DRAFT_452543 [Hypoxylon argillaceum]|nr:hypothetical protein GGS24DRAFT_452543 [Hypoxylon argillaceum]
MRSSNKNGPPMRYYSQKLGLFILKYGVGYPIMGVLWVFTMLCFTGRPPFRDGYCGTGRREARLRKIIHTRMQLNLPRPLYRHRVQNHGSSSRYAFDQAALNRRRRLSLGAGNEGQTKKLQGLLRRARRAVLLHRGWHKPPLERSRLLELPAELRALIWKYALGNRTIHIFYGMPIKRQPYVFPLKQSLFPLRIRRVRKDDKLIRRLCFVECVHRPSPNGWENRHPLDHGCLDCGVLWNLFGECTGKVQWEDTPDAGWSTCPPADEMGKPNIVAVEREWKPLALLSTCRQIYTEAIDLLYSDNTFHFPLPHAHSHYSLSQKHPEPIRDFSSTILAQRLNGITRIATTILVNSPHLEGLSNVLAQELPNLQYLELQAIMAEETDWVFPPANVEALSKVVREMNNRVAGARVILRADLDSKVLSLLDIPLPNGLQVIKVPDEVRESRAIIRERFQSIRRTLPIEYHLGGYTWRYL